jgi:large subunit ribosomal protein L17
MQHRKSRLRLNKKPHHARMIERNLVTSILLYEAVRTTRKNAKVVQPIVDRLITVAKKQEPRLAIRAINRFVTDENACRKLLEVFKGRYQSRPSGFTTIKPAGSRKGDGAELVDVALIAGASDAKAKNATKTSAQSSHSS